MIIGVTGNSGSGKSSLLRNVCIDKNFLIIDADKVGHKILLTKECKEEVLEFFGENIVIDGEISRKLLGEIVFNDKEKLAKLTEITHKYILEEVRKKICENNKKYDIIFIDAALLIESGMSKMCDYNILVTASLENKISRIMERDGITFDLANARLDKQSKDSYLEKHCDFIIENFEFETSLENFKKIISKWENNEIS